MTATLNTHRSDTQRGPQLGTQLETHPLTEDDMPLADTAVILRVLDDHGLSQSWLADECNLSKAYVSRVLSGQYPVPHDMVRRLYRHTTDSGLVELFAGDKGPMRLDAVRRELVPANVDIDRALPTLMTHLAEGSQHARGGNPRGTLECIHNALNLLLGALDTAAEAAAHQPLPARNEYAAGKSPAPTGTNYDGKA